MYITTRVSIMNLRDFFSGNRFGLILRVSGNTEELARRRFVYLQQVLKAFNIKLFGQPLLQRADIAVWSNPLYANHCDIGVTFHRLQQLRGYKFPIVPHQIKRGDVACVALNDLMQEQRHAGITHSFVWSAEAFSYADKHTIQTMLRAAGKGARAVGVLLHEYADLMRQCGWVMNTAALWDLQSLQAVDGFDLRAQLPPETYGTASSAEEVLTEIALVLRFGRCIALVPAPEGAGYIAPHPERQPREAEIHAAKITTKRSRFGELAGVAGCAVDYIATHGLL